MFLQLAIIASLVSAIMEVTIVLKTPCLKAMAVRYGWFDYTFSFCLTIIIGAVLGSGSGMVLLISAIAGNVLTLPFYYFLRIWERYKFKKGRPSAYDKYGPFKPA